MVNINLQNIGNLGIELYNKFYKIYTEKIKINNLTNIGCNITIEDLRVYSNNNGCKVLIRNICTKDSINNFKILIEAIYEVLLNVDDDIRIAVLNSLSVTMKDLSDYIDGINTNKGFIANCSTRSNTSNTIVVDRLFIPYCIKGEFVFINTGRADSNCGIVEIANSFNIEREPIIKNISPIISLDNIIYMSITILSAVILVTILTVYSSNIVLRILYYDRNDIGNRDNFKIRKPLLGFIRSH